MDNPSAPVPVILVTGFAPAADGPSDPTGDLLALIAAGPPGSAEVRTQLLPADADGALMKAVEAMDRLLPDAVIALGPANGAGEILIERVALNLQERTGSERPESGPARQGGSRGSTPEGVRGPANGPKNEPIDAAGPAAYFSTLPVDVMAEALKRGDVPASVSNAAMSETGNRLFYALLHYVALRGQETWFQRPAPAGLVSRIGLLRIPRASDRRARMRAREAGRSLPLETALRGVSLAIDATAAYLAAESSDTRLIPS